MKIGFGRIIILFMSFFLLSSCLSPVKTPPDSKYIVKSTPHVCSSKPRTAGTLLVSYPSAAHAYNTSRMAFTLKPYQIEYFGKNHWAATPSQMLYFLLIQTLQDTHHFHAVVTARYPASMDYVLTTTILEFQHNFICRPARFQIKLRAQLIDAKTNKVFATKQFYRNEPFFQNNPYAGVIAANRATENILRDVACFCINATR